MRDRDAPLTYPFATPPEAGAAVELAEGVLWLRVRLPMKPDHVNCYAFREENGWTIVDTGLNSGSCRAAWEAAFTGPFNSAPVNRILVTHHHPDHIGLAGWFQTLHGAELLTTRTAWLMARMLILDIQHSPVPETLDFWRSAGMPSELIEKRRMERPFNFSDVVAHLPLGFRRIQEGDVIELGGRQWDVRIGNGHAPEHATLWSRDGELVIGGDQLLPTISPNLGVYATEPDADPVREWIEACERLRRCATTTQLVLPGHGRPFTGLPERFRQLIDNHVGALDRLLEFLDEPHTAVDCFKTLFAREIGPDEYGLGLVEAVAHLNHLRKLGKVERTFRRDGAWLWQRS